MISYVRTYVLQSAHLNDEGYPIWWAAQKADQDGDYKTAFNKMRELLPHIHGHNFDVEIRLTGEPFEDGPEKWLIEDQQLTELVMQWDNRNLSALPDFVGREMRATTENMARVLAEKVREIVGTNVARIDVTVWERPEIRAEVALCA